MLIKHKTKGFVWLMFVVLSAGLLINAIPVYAARDQGRCENAYFSQTRFVNGEHTTCHYDSSGLFVTEGSCLDVTAPITMVVEGVAFKAANSDDFAVYTQPVVVDIRQVWTQVFEQTITPNSDGNFSLSLGTLTKGSHSAYVKNTSKTITFCSRSLYIEEACDTCLTDIATASAQTYQRVYSICDQVPAESTTQKQKCEDCVGGDGENYGIWTAIGCIPRDPETIVSVFLRFGLGMGGGVALLMILGSGFMMTVSQGDPKQIDTAKQWLTSAIAGLLFIIFSVTILQFIGYSVFQIPGFGG